MQVPDHEYIALLKWKSEAEQTIMMLKDEIQTLRHELRQAREDVDPLPSNGYFK